MSKNYLIDTYSLHLILVIGHFLTESKRKLDWFGHVLRRNDDATAKIFELNELLTRSTKLAKNLLHRKLLPLKNEN